jgi:hypothetical protein
MHDELRQKRTGMIKSGNEDFLKFRWKVCTKMSLEIACFHKEAVFYEILLHKPNLGTWKVIVSTNGTEDRWFESRQVFRIQFIGQLFFVT